MPMRLSGLMSGMDTESIIQQLVSAKKTKVTKAVKAQKSLKYKQDAWKDLNKQIVNLYNKSLTQMRFQSSYMKKVTKVSNSNIVSVITGENAMNGVQSLEVNKLARSGYLTGGQIGYTISDGKGKDINGNDITSKTKLSDLGYATGTGSFQVKTADGVMDISVDENSTIGNFVSTLRDAGLNVNFDEANGRIHITSKGSGTKNDFSIIANDGNGWNALTKLGLNYKDNSALDHYAGIFGGGNLRELLNQKAALGTREAMVDKIKGYIAKNTDFKNAWDSAVGTTFDVMASDFDYNNLSDADKQTFDNALRSAVTATSQGSLSGDKEQLEKLQSDWGKLTEVETKLNQAIDDKINAEQTAYYKNITALRDTLVEKKSELWEKENQYLQQIQKELMDPDVKAEWDKALEAALDEDNRFNVAAKGFDYNELTKEQKQAFESAMQQAFNKAYEKAQQTDSGLTPDQIIERKEELEKLNSDWNNTVSEWNSTEASLKSVDEDLEFNDDGTVKGLSETAKKPIENQIMNAVSMYDELNDASGVYKGHKNDAADAEIMLNGVSYTSNKNTFDINGLTLTVSATTAPGESVTITTEDDTNGIYDMVKNFFKEYNAVINQMDKLYNAEAAKGYEPLTDEEKEAMSDSQIEEWENKIKDSILRKDSTLSFFASEMKRIMMEGVEMEDGKKMYLSNFGIGTLNYYVAKDNERYAYHIDGDPDDENTANNPDKLKSMIANDPDTVVSFFTKLSQKMSDKMFEMMRSEEGVSSAMTAYEDKKMQKEYDDYTAKIKELEKKLADYEDKWYAKFAAMETALAKMQNNASAVTSLLGG